MTRTTEASLTEWILSNKRLILVVGGFLMILGAGVGLSQARTHKKTQEASAGLHQAEEKLESELKLAGKTPVTDVDRQLAETVSALKKLASVYSGTRAGWEGAFQLAELYSKYEPRSGKAIPAYEATVASAPTSREKAFALYSLAYALEKQGRFDDAIRQLDSAIQLRQPYLKAEISLSRARLLARAGKVDEANKAFEQVSKDYANTDFARKADQWKALRAL